MTHGDATLRIALGEYDTAWQAPHASLARAAVCVQRAAAIGARLVVLPEMCTSGFTMDPGEWAEPLDGSSAHELAALAARHDVWILAGLAVRANSEFRNVAAVFDPAGTLQASYAKQRLFAYGREDEHYEAGSTPLAIDIDGVRVAPLICYDLRFPELFRAVATQVDCFIVIANWPAARRAHWDALLPARAIENQAYVVGVNRTGEAGKIVYDGGSAAFDPWGAVITQRVAIGSPSIADISTQRVASIRAKYPFLADAAAVERIG